MTSEESTLGETGQALLLLIVVVSLDLPLGVGFVSSMNRQQRLAGDRYRATAALYLAEAGIQKALWYLEREAPDGSRDASWRPSGHAEDLSAGDLRGRFVLDVADDTEGRVLITSWGEVGRVRRGVRVVAKVAPGILDYGLFGAGLVAIDGDQAVLSLVEVRDHCRPGVMLASNTEIWFRAPGSRLEFTPCGENPAVLKIGLPDTMRLTVGDVHGAARFLGLREFGILTGPVETQTFAPEGIPTIDVEALRRRAEGNEANVDLNRAAGEAADRPDLRDQRHSSYSRDQFALLLRHLRGSGGVLVGAVYVTGRTIIPADVPLAITDGFLVAEGGLTIEAGGSLTMRHGRKANLLPGLVAVGTRAPLVIGEGARVVVDGAVVAEGLIDVRDAASVQVVGAVVATAPEFSLRLNNAALRIRYEPTVPGTVGLLARDGRRRVFPLAWHEVR